ncbi:MAG: hypothetical protein ACT4PE_05510 [Candidatus Eiseniibacteriota bacterium]
MTEDLPICQRVRRLVEGALPYWRPLREARREEIDFLDGDRYEDDHGPYNKDRRDRQFRGQEISSVARNKAGQSTANPRSIEALPVDRFADADDAEIAVSILEWELNHPQKGFDDVLDEVIIDALESRAGCAMLEFDPELGQYGGETFWRWKDPNLVMWTPGFSDPHHVACEWMIEAQRIPIATIKQRGKGKGKGRWRGTDEIVGDATATSSFPGEGSTNPLDRIGVPGESYDDDHVWVYFCWYKNDPSTYKREKESNELPEGERYMGCDNPECQYRSMTQDELLLEGKLEDGEELPEDMDPCPLCGGHLSRRDMSVVEDEVLAYPKGRRLVIMPAFQQTPDDLPFYDGPWPVPKARSFPILWVTAYAKGGRPMGDSDTTRNWDAQIASDQLMTMAFDRLMRHQTYYLMPSVGITDTNGKRFEFRDDQYNVMLADMSDVNRPAPTVTTVQGASLDSAWPTYWNSVQQVLLGPQGTNDMGLTPDSSKNIAAATVAQLDRIGNIPVEHFNRRKNRALGKAYGVHWDYIRATYTSRRLARMQIGDETLVDRLRGDDQPNFDFIVSEAPPFTGLEKARSEAFTALYQMAQTTPMWVDLFAEVNRLPQSVVRKVKRAIAEQKMKAERDAMMAAQQMGAGIPDDLSGLEPPAMEPNPMDVVQQQYAPAPEAPMVA